MKHKQDNLQGFRGFLKREMRNIAEEAKALREQEEMKKNMDHIKILLLGNANQKNDFMFIKLRFRNPVIPNQFIPEIRLCLEEIFNEHF